MKFLIILRAVFGVGLWWSSSSVYAQQPTSGSEADALELASATVEDRAASSNLLKLFGEGAIGFIDPRYADGTRSVRRGSADMYFSTRLTPQWRFVLSDRIDSTRPVAENADGTINSLRELYFGLDLDSDSTSLDVGRINWRQGPAYGFNPTDFLRDGALRTITTADPLALRENRLGTVILRGQHSWQGSTVALGWAPKLADAPNVKAYSADLGATNGRERALLTTDIRLLDRSNVQLLLYKEQGLEPQTGASVTALVSSAVVAFAEWAHARQPALVDNLSGSLATTISGNRFAAGATYTTSGKLSLTAEIHYNRFALNQAGWDRLALVGGLPQLGRYLLEAQRRQDLPSRRAYMLYAALPSAGASHLDLAGFVRLDADDESRLVWLEARYKWPAVDVALQWQGFSGSAISKYGIAPYRQTLQLVATYHFK